MGTSATTTTNLPLLKRIWGTKFNEPLLKKSKLFSLLEKDTNFGGEGRYVIVTIAPTSGGSADFPTALETQGATQEKRFFVQHRKEYQVFSIQGDLIARSKGDKNAIIQALEQQANKARYAFARALAAKLWGNGGGSLGRIDSTTTLTSTTLKLANRADFVRFEPGMYLQFASDDGSSASPAGMRGNGLPKLQILNIDTVAGTLTMSAALNTVPAIATGDYIFRAGDYSLAWTGVLGWNPTTAPGGSDSFMGLNRGTAGHIQRLAGTIVSGGGKPKEETLIDAGAEGQLAGIDSGEVALFCHPLDMRDVVKEVSSKRFVDVETDDPDIGFSGIEVDGPLGTITMMSEPDVPKGYFWLLPLDEMTIRSAGDVPMMLNEDGVGRLLRAADDDAYQGRLGCYGNLFHEDPGHAVIGAW